MDLDLSGQEAKADILRPYLVADILRPYLVQFRNEIELRWPIWERLDPEKRKIWINNAADKDPLFDLFIDVVKYSRKWLLSVEDGDG
jgi:hypothetical protein